MNAKEILNLDCREEKNKRIIQEHLRKIKPFSKYSIDTDIPLQKLERCFKVLCNNYGIFPKPDFIDTNSSNDGIIYCIGFFDQRDGYKQIKKCFGVSLYELFSKAVILLYELSKTRDKKKK